MELNKTVIAIPQDIWQNELNFFQSVDRVLANELARQIGNGRPPSLPRKAKASHYAHNLYESIISQQLSVKASDTIWKRFVALVEDPSLPENVLLHSVDELRSIGLSRQKAGYILSIAELTGNGTVKLDHLDELNDQEIIDELVLIKGVGQWTAEMFLIFTLGRADVFSAGDLGLVNAFKKLYGRAECTKEEILNHSKKWSPHRSSASLILWNFLDNKPI